MKHSESLTNIAPALLAAQAELNTIPTDEESNIEGRSYRYTSLGSLLKAAKEALNKHGMVILQPGEISQTANLVNMETVIIHESGEFISGTFSVPYGQLDPQKAGSAITYARRYSAGSMLGMVSEKDDDGASSVPKKKDPPKEPPKSAPPKSAPPKSKPAEKPKEKPRESRSSLELREAAVAKILAHKKRIKESPNDAVEINGLIERIEKSVKDMCEEEGIMDKADYVIVRDLVKEHFSA